ncbi:hypothetical protein K1T71_010353 [Dendrolimus kikuchii]|uniref:Uncharacterized protein n=1 Tax=Dendrolimus kikuchii TaxID=765133 RepID=A0ACC1CSK1_9NEOP|nr:hypothetical protein K1T71_010353 [Dendrolimus kikuchii]
MEDQNAEKIDSLKLKLKSATKFKLIKETELLKLRNQERSLKDELANTKNEVELLMEQLEDIKNQISQTKNQISMIDICKISEKTKIEMYTSTLNNHKKGYEALFKKERDIIELRNKKQKEKEADEEELIRQKEKVITEKNEQIAKDAYAIEMESDAIEKECIVLRKRNNALMLRLRRKLLETESVRRRMRKVNIDSESYKGSGFKNE